MIVEDATKWRKTPKPDSASCWSSSNGSLLARRVQAVHTLCVVSWRSFAQQQPEMAAQGRSLLYQHGVGLAFLATVGRDGHPRVHPVCPLLTDEGMFVFVVPSPKQRDLERSGSYALHSFPCPDNEDAFYVTGHAALVSDGGRRAALAGQFVREREAIGVAAPSDDDALFEFEIESCLLTRTTGHGDPAPDHQVWHAG
jgi:hypothetical protein